MSYIGSTISKGVYAGSLDGNGGPRSRESAGFHLQSLKIDCTAISISTMD